MKTDNFCFYLQNRLIQTIQTGGQWYNDTVAHTTFFSLLKLPNCGLLFFIYCYALAGLE